MRLILVLLLLSIQIGLNANPFKVFNRSTGLVSDKINSIVSDNQYLWLATDLGVNRLTLEGENIKETKVRNTTRPVLSILNDETFLWVGIQGKGLYKLTKERLELIGIYPSIFGKENVQFIEKTNGKIIIITESKKAFEFVPLDSTITELTLNIPVDSIGLSPQALKVIKGLKNGDNAYFRGSELWIGRNKVENHTFDITKPIATYRIGSYLLISNNNHLWKYSLDHKVLLDYQLDYNLSSFAAHKFNGFNFIGSDKGLLLYTEKLDTLLFNEPVAVVDTVAKVKADTATMDTVSYVPEAPKKPLFNFDNLDFSILNIVLACLGFIAYTVLLVWLTSFKYKKDIKTLEDELLRKMKGKGEV